MPRVHGCTGAAVPDKIVMRCIYRAQKTHTAYQPENACQETLINAGRKCRVIAKVGNHAKYWKYALYKPFRASRHPETNNINGGSLLDLCLRFKQNFYF